VAEPRLTTCRECGAQVVDVRTPVHAYVPSAPGCWQLFGEVQADEMQRFGYPAAHRLVVDAYMAQHPGDGADRRARQSTCVHLIGLCAVIERGLDGSHATQALRDAVRGRPDYPVLRRDDGPGELNVLHMVGAVDADDYARRAREWAVSVWDSWRSAHGMVRLWLEGYPVAM
jgi:hypothetical protein